MSYRDYEREEEKRQYEIQRLEEETQRMKLRLDRGELASILAELSINKQNRY
jgi:hypothetical protein